MSERLLYGNVLADRLMEEAREDFSSFQALRKTARLTTVLVGKDPASKKYIDMKQAEGEKLGVAMERVDLDADISQDELENTLASLSNREDVTAVLAQYPLPGNLNYLQAIQKLDPKKDVDGLHPSNLGLLIHDPVHHPGLIPCTPNGILQLLQYGGVEIERANVAVVGRGLTVGGPLSVLLNSKNNGANATVTLLHSGSKDLAEYTRAADIVIGATGRPGLITEDMITKGTTLVSVGVKYDKDDRARGDFTHGARQIAGDYVPVTRGIGPMTRANLWKNVVRCWQLQHPA